MTTDDKRLWAEALLRKKYNELDRIPKKDDFDTVELSKIKAFLGPWPRALEAAGLKEAKCTSTLKKRNSKKSNNLNGRK